MKKKILIITPEFPYPLNSGGKQAQFNLIDKLRDKYEFSILFHSKDVNNKYFIQLKKLWSNVHFYPYVPKVKFDTKVGAWFTSFTKKYKLTKDFFLRKKERSLITQKSLLYFSLAPVFYDEFLNYINEVANKNFDIIQVEFYEYLSLINILPEDKILIFVHHEIRYIRNQLEMSSFNLNTIYDKYIYNTSKMFELANLVKYDKIITLSDVDKNKLAEYLNESLIYSSPALINYNDSKLYNDDYKFNNRLIFLGNSKHYPNYEGLKWFFSNIWLKIKSANKNIELCLIGDWANFLFENSYSTDNVIIEPYVEDLNSYLKNSIMVVPIRIGSGIRMKILDAIVNKIPIVTTSIGKEGLDLENNVDCLIADYDHEFIECINKLTSDIFLQKTLIKNASSKFEKLYSTQNLLNKRMNIYDS